MAPSVTVAFWHKSPDYHPEPCPAARTTCRAVVQLRSSIELTFISNSSNESCHQLVPILEVLAVLIPFFLRH